jgi:N utilization substance protein B
VNEYTVTLVEGVIAEQERIDAMLTEHARGWTLDRMPGVDRNLLRIATYEILCVDDVPDAVAISEAVELARDLSTDESPGFVSGLLSAIVKNRAATDAPVVE